MFTVENWESSQRRRKGMEEDLKLDRDKRWGITLNICFCAKESSLFSFFSLPTDTTRTLDWDLRLQRKQSLEHTLTKSAHSPQMSAFVGVFWRELSSPQRWTGLSSLEGIIFTTSQNTTVSRRDTETLLLTAPLASLLRKEMLWLSESAVLSQRLLASTSLSTLHQSPLLESRSSLLSKPTNFCQSNKNLKKNKISVSPYEGKDLSNVAF